MDNKFELDTRYWVAKTKDVDAALSQDEKVQLDKLLGKVASYRLSSGKSQLKCVVIEHDWPLYDETVAGIQRISEGNVATVESTISEMAANARENGYPEHVEALQQALDRLNEEGLISSKME
ncbi:hypothetical protein [Vibrio owensii]|uniref:hypothetical protein n=1 Tax=Vibrio owensii TaxID=696485 RepID=UPI00036F2352|nr:hypothetical protein [Vibrio owensii]